MIKIINNRPDGYLFHYAHFLFDCLFNEINSDVHKYNIVYREKTIYSTIGNFDKIYEEVMQVKNIELPTDEFESTICETINTTRITNPSLDQINYFRMKIFNIYNINLQNNSFPKVLLIKRGLIENLVNDTKINNNMKYKYQLNLNGIQRREIIDIDKLEDYLKKKFTSFKTIILENIPFKEQVESFKNAEVIICMHGAAITNLLFCNKNTLVIEVLPSFSQLPSTMLKEEFLNNPDIFFHINYNPGYIINLLKTIRINRVRCKNELDIIINTINENIIKYKKEFVV